MTESPGRASRALLVVVGASVTVLVVLDGSVAGRGVRALVVVAVIAGALRLPARHRAVALGHALLGAVSLAIGAGFLPHLAKAPDTVTGYAALGAAAGGLAQRVDVDPARIGVVGMSMGGEEAIGAAASDGRIRAVVAEGATTRTAADKDWLSEVYGVRGRLQEQLDRLQYGLADLLSDADAPTALRDAVGQADGVAFLLIAAGEVAEEGHAATHIAAAAPDRVEVWTVPGAGHTDGLDVEPDDWERRVVGFLDAHL